MTKLMTNIRIHALAAMVLALLLSSSSVEAVDANEAVIDAYDTAVLLVSPFRKRANGTADFKSTVPNFVQSRRPVADAKNRNTIMPIGIVTLHGTACEGAEVLISAKEGRFLASWPPAASRSSRLKWVDLNLTKESGGTLRGIDSEHWLKPLRAGDALFVKTETHSERGFLYDIEIPYQLPIELKSDDARKISVINHGKMAVHDLTIVWPNNGKWRIGRLATLAPAAKGEKTAIAIEFAAAEEDSRENAAATLRAPLAELGLPEFHINRLLATFATLGVDDEQMTVVYRLDPQAIEEMASLEIYPAPRKQVRATFVIVHDLDPTLLLEVKTLITQLGAESWAEREAASKRLHQMGNLCRSELNNALKSKDAEVVYRAENLLTYLPKLPVEKKKKAKKTSDKAASEDLWD